MYNKDFDNPLKHQSTMKKILCLLMICLPLISMAGNKNKVKVDKSLYLAGVVPEVDGRVVFKKSFKVPGKSTSDIYSVMKPFVEHLVEESIPGPGNYARISMDTPDTLVAKICEYQVYKKAPLYLDRSRMRYTMSVIMSNERVEISMFAINYYYEEDEEGNRGKTIRAEEWINDANALNKSKTKLYPRSDKFRIKTVDRMNELFDAAMDAFDEKFTAKEPEPVVPQKKVRQTIQEE